MRLLLVHAFAQLLKEQPKGAFFVPDLPFLPSFLPCALCLPFFLAEMLEGEDAVLYSALRPHFNCQLAPVALHSYEEGEVPSLQSSCRWVPSQRHC